MRIIKIFMKFMEYTLPFLGVFFTGIGLRLSIFISPIQNSFPDDLQLEIDLAFNILVLYVLKDIIKKFFSIDDHTLINAELINPENSTNTLTLEKITDEPAMPKYVELNINILKAHYLKGYSFLEIRYGRRIAIAIDNKPKELKYKQDHEKKNIKITLNTIFNFMLEKPQKETITLKILTNSTTDSDSSIELFFTSTKWLDSFKFKDSLVDLDIKII